MKANVLLLILILLIASCSNKTQYQGSTLSKSQKKQLHESDSEQANEAKALTQYNLEHKKSREKVAVKQKKKQEKQLRELNNHPSKTYKSKEDDRRGPY